MRQYAEMKAKNPDCLLFFRMGDFYEMFFEDARLVSSLLSLTLTTRDRNLPEEERVPMCGVPYHSAEGYIAKLIRLGYRVAICEQTEDPALAKGLVKRDIVRILSPGAILEPNLLEEKANNFCACVVTTEEGVGLTFCDISTGELNATQFTGGDTERRVINELGRYMPRETVLDGKTAESAAVTAFLRDKLRSAVQVREAEPGRGFVQAQWRDKTMEELGLEGRPAVFRAVSLFLQYLIELMRDALSLKLNVYDENRYMELDLNAKLHLELTETMRGGEKKGSLLWVLDMTKTAMGGRALRSWLERPLVNPAEINRRLYAVGELKDAVIARGELRRSLSGFPDIERILTRILYGTAGARDLRALRGALSAVPEILSLIEPMKAAGLREVRRDCHPLPGLEAELDAALVDNPPFSIREGGFIRDGYHPEVDRLRRLAKGAREAFGAMETAERLRTGIKTLKVGYNKVFGYYLEVSKSYYDQIPPEYTRKQTLVNCERFVTQELKTLETEIVTASDRLAALEGELFEALREKCVEESHRIQATARALAALDALCSFAEAAQLYNYCMPAVDYADICRIKDGRHPVVERVTDVFVPNDAELTKEAPTAIITGPNMAGKSTYMRQIALITLMAHAGSFVPAAAAHIGVTDRIFTRVGASDDVAGGHSTFMVEMTEVADILQFATGKSLILFDEVGRGTSTFDGMSVAQAVLEYTHKKIGAKTLFATHYHELTALEQTLPGLKNYSVSVKKRGEEIVFLRRIVPGGADDSFGVEVAKLAGLPGSVVTRARSILKELESGAPARREPLRTAEPSAQVSMEHLAADAVLALLRQTDINTLTPIEALNTLHRLVNMIK
jgi:DNA mismatch repair protein MutS